ncbi:MAG: HAMP domain-containing histidine kinase [Clostridiales bacterium]|nr:HAMP domain-containing histidine kinase [Clostridiales bacterium]
MKSGMRQKLLLLMSSLVAFVVLFGWLINSVFLEKFYIYYKENTLLRTMAAINQMYDAGTVNELELVRMQVEQGVQVVVFSSNLEVRYFAWQNAMNLGFGRLRILGGPDLSGIINRRGGLSYEISRNYDDRLRMEYLDLVGALDNGDFVLLRMPVQAITDSVGVANRFLLIIGAISLILSVIISAPVSKQVARPIKDVESIARSMAQLDFSRRINVKTKGEIGSLAASINTLSDKLKDTIQELQDKNRQLEEDIQYISRLDERRKDFLSSVSHELKTPIALIRGYAEALEERVVTSEESRDFYYHVIADEADKMNALVKKLMSLDNLEVGQEELYLEDFDIMALVRSVVQRGKTLQGAENLQFVIDGPESVWVYADNFLIEEVVFNYLTNAIHYASGRNLVRVVVKPLPSGEAGSAGTTAGTRIGADAGMVRVEVFNSGSYLNDEERELVWDSFYKADKSRSREYGGSGLGLSVVRAIMERHKCAYGLENIEDGVSFWFALPRGYS